MHHSPPTQHATLRLPRPIAAALTLLLLATLAASPAFAADAPTPPPEPPANLITNGDLELDQNNNGIPDNWYHSEPQHWAGPAENTDTWKTLRDLWAQQGAVPPVIPFHPPAVLEGGSYLYENPGDLSGRCISIDETADLKWGEWNTTLANIKPNTTYVILGWTRQLIPAAKSSAPFPRLHIAAFGQLIPIDTPVNRDEWTPFAVQINSGAFNGDCNLGLILPGGPAKIWLDRIAAFAGTTADIPRLLNNGHGAQLHSTRTTATASPDAELPFFFNLTYAFDAPADAKLQITIDLPQGLDLTGGDWGDTVGIQDPTAQLTTIEGRPYVRRTFHITLTTAPAAASAPVRFWLKAAPDLVGTQEAYYRAAWADGSQPRQQININTVRLPKITPLHSVTPGLGGLTAPITAAREERLATDLARLGLQLVILDGPLPLKTSDALRTAGITPANRFTIATDTLPPEAQAVNPAGKPIPNTICPAYRGPALTAAFAQPLRLVTAGNTTLLTDIRTLFTPCCCPRCTEQFQTFLKQRTPDLKPTAPAEFEAAPDKFPRQHALWLEFQSTLQSDFFWTLRKQLDAARDAAPNHTSARIRLLAIISSPPIEAPQPIRTARLAGGSGITAVDAVPPPSPPDPADAAQLAAIARLAAVFDTLLVAPDEHQLDGKALPRRLGDSVARLVSVLPPGGTIGAIIPAGSPDITAQALEAAFAGARTIILDPATDADGRDLQQLVDTLALLQPFDKLLDAARPADILRPTDDTTSVRTLKNGDQYLLLIRSDAARLPAEIKLKLNLPPVPAHGNTPAAPLALIDPADNTVIATIAPTAADLTIPLARPTRIYLITPEASAPHR